MEPTADPNKVLKNELSNTSYDMGVEVSKDQQTVTPPSWIAKATQVGADFGYGMLKNDSFSASIHLTDTAEVVGQRLQLVIQQMAGKTIQEGNLPEGTISVVVGSGAMNLNPALVRITILPSQDGGSDLSAVAFAKEGLIKQHTAEKAVKTILGAIQPGANLSEIKAPNLAVDVNGILCLSGGGMSVVLGFFLPQWAYIAFIPGLMAGFRGRKTEKKWMIWVGMFLNVLGIILAALGFLGQLASEV